MVNRVSASILLAQKSFVTATKTRRKQQIEMIHKALADQQEKMREERENYVISSVAIANEASYEPGERRFFILQSFKLKIR